VLESSSVPDYDAAVRACPRRGGPRCDFGNHGARTIAVCDGPLRVETVVQAGYGRNSRSCWSWSENFAGRLPLRPLSLARARFSPSVPMPCSFPRASSRCRASVRQHAHNSCGVRCCEPMMMPPFIRNGCVWVRACVFV